MRDVDGYLFREPSDGQFYPAPSEVPRIAAALRAAGITPEEFNAPAQPPKHWSASPPQARYYFTRHDDGTLTAERNWRYEQDTA